MSEPHAADDFASIAAALREITGDVQCESCRDEGWIDQTLGGEWHSGWAECPDCGNPDRMPQP